MPSYTLAELMSNAPRRAGRRGDLDASEVSFYVNMAYEEIRDATQHALSEKIAVSSTTSGENRVELPSDFNSPINVSVSQGKVTLRGSVATPHDRALAGLVARMEPGVEEVDNQLIVTPSLLSKARSPR